MGENRDVRGIVPSEAKLNELVNDVPDIAIAIPPGPEAITLTPYYASPVKTLVCWWDLMGRKHCY